MNKNNIANFLADLVITMYKHKVLPIQIRSSILANAVKILKGEGNE